MKTQSEFHSTAHAPRGTLRVRTLRNRAAGSWRYSFSFRSRRSVPASGPEGAYDWSVWPWVGDLVIDSNAQRQASWKPE